MDLPEWKSQFLILRGESSLKESVTSIITPFLTNGLSQLQIMEEFYGVISLS